MNSYRSFALICLVTFCSLVQAQTSSTSVLQEQALSQPVAALINANQQTVLASRIPSWIKDIPVNRGEAFKKGDVLVALDCNLYQTERRIAQNTLNNTQKIHQSNARLYQLKAISDAELWQSEAAVERANGELKLAKLRASYCTIKAPFSGRVVKWHSEPFASVAIAAPIIEILDDSVFTVQANVPSSWLSELTIGDDFVVSIDENKQRLTAVITQIGSQIEAVSRTIFIKGEITSDDAVLTAGMSGSAQFR